MLTVVSLLIAMVEAMVDVDVCQICRAKGRLDLSLAPMHSVSSCKSVPRRNRQRRKWVVWFTKLSLTSSKSCRASQ